jgi:uroporphyrinogen decarboxylase
MIAGKGTPDQAPARLFAYRDSALFQKLIDLLVSASIDYLSVQIKTGVDAVQIFDSWAGVLPEHEFERWCLAPIKAIVAGLKALHPHVRIIAFPRGAGSHLPGFASASGTEALGLDTAVDPAWAAKAISKEVILQGNLDPLALVAGGQALEYATRTILSAFREHPHIFNLGHGILPETPIENVEHLLKILRSGG